MQTTLATGNETIGTTSGSGQLSFTGTITRNADATVQFTAGGGAIYLPGLSTTNGIIGGWAMIGLGSDAGNWATLSSGNVVAYSSYTTKTGGSSLALSSSGGTASENIKITSRSSSTACTLNSSTSGTYRRFNTILYEPSSTSSSSQVINISSGQTLRLGRRRRYRANMEADTGAFNLGSGSSGIITAGGAGRHQRRVYPDRQFLLQRQSADVRQRHHRE